MPEALRQELTDYYAAMRAGRIADRTAEEQPCLWYDPETRGCRHYEHRPQNCRDFEVGGEDCLGWRREAGIGGAV
jgi:Fe-S-cluster containining protein